MNINQHGYYLKGLKPNAHGLCIYQIINAETKEIYATTDKPCTSEEALSQARKFLEEDEDD